MVSKNIYCFALQRKAQVPPAEARWYLRFSYSLYREVVLTSWDGGLSGCVRRLAGSKLLFVIYGLSRILSKVLTTKESV